MSKSARKIVLTHIGIESVVFHPRGGGTLVLGGINTADSHVEIRVGPFEDYQALCAIRQLAAALAELKVDREKLNQSAESALSRAYYAVKHATSTPEGGQP